ncbi:MAG: Lrp/AsnC family transcriptional regulator [Nitrososphaerales archaeon]
MDDLDVRLLAAMRKDARRPFLALSKDLGVSDATIHKRIRVLENAGIIKGYTARLDAEQLGYRITAFIELRIKPGSAESVGQKLAKFPNVLEVFELHSHCDILLKVQVKDLHELRDELINRISSIPEIVSKETNVVLNTVKSVNGPPI